MIKEPLISIIIPVYKVEKYLGQCMQNVLSQTYGNLEIILVDDGSPDSCGQMCEDFAEKDSRVVVIHRENGGLSEARNTGLDAAGGEYVAFIDSDDYVSDYYIGNLYKALNGLDAQMAVSCYEAVYDQTPPKTCAAAVKDSEIHLGSPKECLKRICYQNSGIEISAWGKLYHRSLFSDIRYPSGLLYEDIPVTPQLLHRCSRIAVIPNVDYYYRQRRESIRSNSFHPQKLAAVENTRELMEFINAAYPEIRLAGECRYFSTVSNILFHIDSSEYQDVRRKLWAEICKYRRDILKDPEGRKKARIAAVISYFGYDFMKFAFGVMNAMGGKSH